MRYFETSYVRGYRGEAIFQPHAYAHLNLLLDLRPTETLFWQWFSIECFYSDTRIQWKWKPSGINIGKDIYWMLRCYAESMAPSLALSISTTVQYWLFTPHQRLPTFENCSESNVPPGQGRMDFNRCTTDMGRGEPLSFGAFDAGYIPSTN